MIITDELQLRLEQKQAHFKRQTAEYEISLALIFLKVLPSKLKMIRYQIIKHEKLIAKKVNMTRSGALKCIHTKQKNLHAATRVHRCRMKSVYVLTLRGVYFDSCSNGLQKTQMRHQAALWSLLTCGKDHFPSLVYTVIF
jgi:hypothetical protein